MLATQDPEKAAADLARLLKLHPPAGVTWDGRNLVVQAAGQILPERPTAWADAYKVIYRP
ncbi:MAG: hypothetical protein ACRYG8_06820 [Janthinobacterium lividum]